MAPSVSTLKRLFARSGNRCPFPKCTATLVFSDTLIGEVCHIKGEKPGAARYDPLQTDEERHAHDNLIAMCPNHHTVIDSDEEAYSVARIVSMKAQHETKVAFMSEGDAERIAVTASNGGVLTIGQTGGISAQSIHAQTLNLNHGVIADAAIKNRQILAVESFWNAIIALRKEFGDLIYVDDILTAKEIDGSFKNGWSLCFGDINSYARVNTIMVKFTRARAMDVEAERPFVSPRLWSIYFIIRATYGRIACLFEMSFTEASYRDWRYDSGVNQLVGSILPSGIIDSVTSSNSQGLRETFDHLENLFMSEANMQRQSD